MAGSITRKLYLKEKSRRPLRPLVVGAMMLLVAFGAVLNYPPVWYWEVMVALLVLGGSFLIIGSVMRRKKWGAIGGVGIMGILMLNRMGVLDGLSLGIWLLFLGLISLFN